MSRIAVAMSGGVDSSVVAALLQQQGHEVIGITMQLFEPCSSGPAPRPTMAPRWRHNWEFPITCCGWSRSFVT